MDLTTPNIRIMGRGYSRLFQEGRATVAPWYSRIATVVPSASAETVYPFLLGLPRMREWVGERVIHNVATSDYTLKNRDFELTVGVPRNSIEDDTYGIYNPVASMMGQQAEKYPDDLLVQLLLNGESIVGPDGQFFFDTDHPVSPINATLGVQSNLFTGRPLTGPNFDIVRSAMTTLREENGRIMRLMPNLLVVPPQLEFTAKQILNATTVLTGGANIYAGAAEILVIPELAEDPTSWYLLNTMNALKPFVFQVRRAPRFVPLTAVNDENVFWLKEFIWGIDARGAAGFGLWFFAGKAKA